MAVPSPTSTNPSQAPFTRNEADGSPYDVHGKYPWTLSEGDIRKFVPKVNLTEYKLTNSGELNSFRNSLAAAAESQAGLLVRGAAAGAIAGGATAAFRQSSRGAAFTAGGVVAGIAGSLLAGKATSVITGLDPEAPYKGLYPAKKTGNIYHLPYLNIENMTDTTGAAGAWKAADESVSNNLGKVGKGLLTGVAGRGGAEFANLITAVNSAAETARQLDFALRSAGSATEKIKVFAPKEEGDAINLVFYLFNTKSKAHIALNWNFLYKLTYQNLPNRRSINLLDPPCVYEVEVPGFKRFPIAVIESFKVTNEGTTRLVDITTGEVNKETSDTKLIPEAYKITITLRSLLMNTRNLFEWTSNKNKQINVFEGSGGAISNLPFRL